jgi:cytochrome c553
MKKVTLLSLVAAAVLFVACGEETKKSAAEATVAVKETAKVAVEETKETATKAVEASKEVAAEAVESLKEAVAPSENVAGAAAYAKCAGCHGKDGKTKALGKSEVVAGQSAADLTVKMAEYKAGTRNVTGMGTLMKGQVASMSDDDIKAVSEYMSAM